MTQQILGLRNVSISFGQVLKISKNFRHLPGNVQHVFGIFYFILNENKCNSYAKSFPRVSKKISLYIKIILGFFLLYNMKNFWIAQKFPDSNATLLPWFFSLSGCYFEQQLWTLYAISDNLAFFHVLPWFF